MNSLLAIASGRPIPDLALCALLAALLVAGFCTWLRRRTYRRYLGFDPRRSYSHKLEGPEIEAVAVRVMPAGFALSPLAAGAAGALLELEVRTSLRGRCCDPYVEIEARGVRCRQYFERGARGVRFLNLSRFLAGLVPGEVVRLRGGALRWTTGWARLHLCREKLEPRNRVLVVAPHPDDAEIAAFGVYRSTRATVVTLSAGEASDRYLATRAVSSEIPAATVARLRVWDSITVPFLGGLDPAHSINLCYPDGRLAEMCAAPERDFNGSAGHGEFAALRRMNLSPATPPAPAAACWNGLVADLAHLLRQVKPGVIVTPYPFHDPHPDHGYSTVAVCDALRQAGIEPPRFYFYLSHYRVTELYPLGPVGSGVTLPPVFGGNGVACDGFCSQALSPEEQLDKHLALEAMHDMREIRRIRGEGWPNALRRLRAEVHAKIHGLGNPPTSHFRRAVRAEELFFVLSAEHAAEAVDDFRKAGGEPLADFPPRF